MASDGDDGERTPPPAKRARKTPDGGDAPARVVALAEGDDARVEQHARAIDATALSDADIADLQRRVAQKPRQTFTLFGRPCVANRTQAFFAPPHVDGYKFSRVTIANERYAHPVIDACLAAARALGVPHANAALVNVYDQPGDYIAAHSDDERQHCKGAPIIAFSFGGERTLRVRAKADKARRWDVPMPARSATVMVGADFQDKYTHEVPKAKKGAAPRMSVTVRAFV